ncbi:hypothetical protein LLE87_27245, partial [Paenibacillus polymyxa]|nr:hypothetical protein [Paenibacillus polymyxa]
AASTISLLRQPHMQKVDWNPLDEFTWIIGLGGYTFAVAVREDSPFKTLKEMIAWAKANPGRLTYGTPGQGSSLHLLMEELARQAGFEAVHVPFKGGGETTTAMLGGHVMVTLNNVGTSGRRDRRGASKIARIRALCASNWPITLPTL